MSKFNTAYQIYREDGLVSLSKRLVRFSNSLVMEARPNYPHLEDMAGRSIHQTLSAWDSLGYFPRVRNPRTFNEKVLHRLTYEDNDLYDRVHNKRTVRGYVSDKIGEDVLPDVYHITEDPKTIPFESLPDSYIIKPTVGPHGIIFVDGGEGPGPETIKNQCNDWLEADFEWKLRTGHSWFRDVTNEVMIEERLYGEMNDVPLDYKMYVFDGRLEYTHVDFNRFGERSRRFFDRDWNPQNFTKDGVPLGQAINKPDEYDEMVEIAETLAESFDFIRVDLYFTEDSGVVFGELTLPPGAGRSPFEPVEWDFNFGSLWNLS